ncbi:hypothetical protein BJY04DRAFT_220572 [Aspergillus karnatakaensis]|uniref:uncharacterized protein n=1 Tax=Aspergillus karnatakaensis TaxID=1810916 RepID=UPI003CCD675B
MIGPAERMSRPTFAKRIQDISLSDLSDDSDDDDEVLASSPGSQLELSRVPHRWNEFRGDKCGLASSDAVIYPHIENFVAMVIRTARLINCPFWEDQGADTGTPRPTGLSLRYVKQILKTLILIIKVRHDDWSTVWTETNKLRLDQLLEKRVR